MITMRTVSIRFGENFAPPCGTIEAHLEILREKGFVWYGKLGAPINSAITKELLKDGPVDFLLIKSGTFDRYWLTVSKIERIEPNKSEYPSYYWEFGPKIKCWLKVTGIRKAEQDVMSKCLVVSSKRRLSEVSKGSLNPCLHIEYYPDGLENIDD